MRLIEDEVLRQVVSEGEARRRSITWDPQIKKALELMPRAEVLLRDPKTFVAERAREQQLARRRAGAAGPALSLPPASGAPRAYRGGSRRRAAW